MDSEHNNLAIKGVWKIEITIFAGNSCIFADIFILSKNVSYTFCGNFVISYTYILQSLIR